MTPKRYPQIADDLRMRILSGELPAGSQLPTQAELMKTYRTSLMTVRRAYDELTREGLIESKDKIGVFVRTYHRYRLEISGQSGPVGFSPTFPSLASRLLTELAGPDRPLNQTVEIRRVTPGRDIAHRLTHPDQGTLLRHTVFYAGDARVSFADGYFPAGLVAGSDLEKPEPLDSIFAVLDDLAVPPYRLVNEVLIRNATAHERAEMGWPSSMYVLAQICTTYTAADEPIYVWESILPGDRWILAEEQYRDKMPAIRAVC
jgi:GntR family transcriptional regulator